MKNLALLGTEIREILEEMDAAILEIKDARAVMRYDEQNVTEARLKQLEEKYHATESALKKQFEVDWTFHKKVIDTTTEKLEMRSHELITLMADIIEQQEVDEELLKKMLSDQEWQEFRGTWAGHQRGEIDKRELVRMGFLTYGRSFIKVFHGGLN